jgi:hypothetical protein
MRNRKACAIPLTSGVILLHLRAAGECRERTRVKEGGMSVREDRQFLVAVDAARRRERLVESLARIASELQ